MSQGYNETVSTHYSAYRPPLHEMILKCLLSEGETFQTGLDVGSGTGYSTIALTKYCSHVFGVEPSTAMLNKATKHEKATYLQGSGEALPLPDRSVNVVTFAGSLFYIKPQLLVEELKRVCQHQASIIPYDFEILVHDVLSELDLNLEASESDYNHEINFTGNDDFKEIVACKEQINLKLNPTELAHILLSSTDRHKIFIEKYRVSDPYHVLVGELEQAKDQYLVKVDTYISKYQLNTIC